MPESKFSSQFHNGQICTSVKSTGTGPPFKCRILHNSNLPHVVSSNLRLDYYKYGELSCAKVLKLAIKTDRVNSTTHCTSSQSTSVKPVIKPRVHKVYNKVLPHPVLPSVVHPPVIKTKGCQRVIKNQKGK